MLHLMPKLIKKIQITGIMMSVKRNDLFHEKGETSYLLMMDPKRIEPKDGKVLDPDGLDPLYFRFNESARKELAVLKPGQVLMIEADFMHKNLIYGLGTILFENCKILSIKNPSMN